MFGQARQRRGSMAVILLVGAAVLVVALAAQVYLTQRSHRRTAESVLRDYAGLAAAEFVRRATSDVGYYGYVPLLGVLKEHASGELPTPEEIGPLLTGGRARDAAALVRATFRFSRRTGRLERVAGPLPEALQGMLETRLAALDPEAPPARRPFRIIEIEQGDDASAFVVSPADEDRLIGFRVRREALLSWFRRAFEQGPLLPASLGSGDVENSRLYLQVQARDGLPIFEAGTSHSPDLTVYTGFDGAYGGIFDGFRLLTSIDPGAASRLVIGGLPRSRLPLVLGLLALTTGLLTAAIYQLRQERALARMRTDFIAQVSHELRTPLAQLRIFTETLLLDRARTPGDRQRALEILDREVRRLCHLVENTLQFSRGERQTVVLERRPEPLAKVIRMALDLYEPLGRAGGTRWASDLDATAWSRVDADAMRQILANLLDNAHKYGPAGQEIRLSLTRENGVARIAVDDQGPGVPPEERDRVWSRFERLERDRKRAISGTGIGLTVVRELAELQDGRTWVEEGVRGGARFVVELPLCPVPGTPASGGTGTGA